jgi:subtilisin-like proprotein convertase family protein
MSRCFLVIGMASLLVACGPSGRNGGMGDDDDGDDDPLPNNCPGNPQTEVCDDGIDNDCDSRSDCGDNDCSGVGSCPVCGEGSHDEASPLALPDGEGNSYESSMTFQGFGPQQTFSDVSNFLGVCVNMEHSWLRDLQIELICPSGQTVILQQFLGQEGSELYMGQPDDLDGTDPNPGVGADYCWTPTASNLPMLEYANQTAVHDMPPGDYQPNTPFSAFIGCTMNGPWTLKVTDLWAIDNGFIFSWDIKFDAGIVDDCSVPPID